MARISTNNRKYMSKEEMVCSLIKQYNLSKTSEFPKANVHILLDHILWAWTEYEGKYKGCKWWSEQAYEQYLHNNKKIKLIHDHVIPRELIRRNVIDMLEKKTNTTDLFNWLENHLIGCVITKKEDLQLSKLGLKQKLGCELVNHKKWNRYNMAGIKRKEIKWY